MSRFRRRSFRKELQDEDEMRMGQDEGHERGRRDGSYSPQYEGHSVVNEMSTLRCKLDTKCKALIILSQDLVECKRERDEYKLMAEQIRDRYSTLKRRVDGLGPSLSNVYSGPSFTSNNSTLAQILCELRDQNKRLLFEVDELRMKLTDSEGDLKLLREQMHSMRLRRADNYDSSPRISSGYGQYAGDTGSYSSGFGQGIDRITSQRLEEVVTQLEMFRNHVTLLEKDLESVLDEKEELVVSRDAYKAKVDRLNERLNDILRGVTNTPKATPRASPKSSHSRDYEMLNDNETQVVPKIVDIDSVLTENRFLKERVKQMDEEKQLANASLTKYKAILEKANSKRNILNMGMSYKSDSSRAGLCNAEKETLDMVAVSVDPNLLSNSVISSKQVQQFIASNSLNNLELTPSTLAHLRSLVVALFEALSDKSSALSLHKKNSKLLGKRINELEDEIRQLQAKEKVYFLMKDSDSFITEDFDTIDSVRAKEIEVEDGFRELEDVGEEDEEDEEEEEESEDKPGYGKEVEDVEADADSELSPEMDALVQQEFRRLSERDEEKSAAQKRI